MLHLARARAHRRAASIATALALLALPGVAHANSFRGLGLVVAGAFVGIPALVVVLVLVVIALILRAKKDASPGTLGAFGAIAIPTALLSMLAFPVAAAFAENLDLDMAAFVFVLWLPIGALGIAAIALAVGLFKRAQQKR